MTLAMDRPTNGRPVDLEALYREKRDRLVSFATKAGRNRDAAEDAVQQAFADLLANPEKASEKRDVVSYIATTAKYGALQETKRRGEQVPCGEGIELEPDRSLSANDNDTTGGACMGDPAIVAVVADALAKLPDNERTAVEMYCLHGQSASAVAERMQRPRRTVYGWIARGLARLREMGCPDLDTEEAAPVVDAIIADRIADAERPVYPSVEEMVVTLTREVGDKRVGVDSARLLLTRTLGPCRRVDAAQAKEIHNARLHPKAPLASIPRASVDEMPPSRRASLESLLSLVSRVAAGCSITHDDVVAIAKEHRHPCSTVLITHVVHRHNETISAGAPSYGQRSGRTAGHNAAVPPSRHKPSTAAPVRQRRPQVLRSAAFLRAAYGTPPPEDLPSSTVLADRHCLYPELASYARSAYIEGLDVEAGLGPTAATAAGRSAATVGRRPTVGTSSQASRGEVPTTATEDVASVVTLSPTSEASPQINRGDFTTVAAKGGDNADVLTPDVVSTGHAPARGHAEVCAPGGAGVTQTVAEAWLTRVDDTVTAMFVHADESTSSHPATFRSMPGAQREITGHLVGRGYRPDGPWTVESDTETWRRFAPAVPSSSEVQQ